MGDCVRTAVKQIWQAFFVDNCNVEGLNAVSRICIGS